MAASLMIIVMNFIFLQIAVHKILVSSRSSSLGGNFIGNLNIYLNIFLFKKIFFTLFYIIINKIFQLNLIIIIIFL